MVPQDRTESTTAAQSDIAATVTTDAGDGGVYLTARVNPDCPDEIVITHSARPGEMFVIDNDICAYCVGFAGGHVIKTVGKWRRWSITLD